MWEVGGGRREVGWGSEGRSEVSGGGMALDTGLVGVMDD